jgi:hypothetical protein
MINDQDFEASNWSNAPNSESSSMHPQLGDESSSLSLAVTNHQTLFVDQ